MNDKDRKVAIAKEIYSQLGGRGFVATTGAKNFNCTDHGLCFDLPDDFAKDGINGVDIALTPLDEYTVTLFKNKKVLKTIKHIYCSDWHDLFWNELGLAIGMPDIIFVQV